MTEGYELHSCDVCEELEGDKSAKESKHCKGCHAWICKDCEHRPDRRARAMFKRAQGRMHKTIRGGMFAVPKGDS
jgi:uncharacterized protein YlaI